MDNNNLVKQETNIAIAEIVGNGYKCFVNTSTGEVFSAEHIDIEARKANNFKEYSPLSSKVFFALMQDYIETIDDFEHQSELMEALSFEQPFQTFKRKVYALHLADQWLTYRNERIVQMLD
jgi:hypothetical protein